MQTKSYFANNVGAALEVARRELGADALLVDSRPAPAHARKLGRVEVTFAWDPPETRIHRATPPEAKSELDDIRQQIASLRVSMDGMASVDGSGVPIAPAEKGAPGGLVFRRLCEAGLGEETARETAEVAPRSGGDPQHAVVQALARRMAIAPFVEMKAGENRTLAFIGQSGRGKTTSLIKTAVAKAMVRRIPVRIYSAGAHGIGGQEQIARYAAILGVPHQSYESIDSLALALNGDAWKGLSLIDTPGISPSDRIELRDFARFFTARPEIERHLVLRADARSADMLHVITTFSGIGVSRLFFTGMDEAVSAGAMVETLIRGGIPATFVGTGQQIPDDLEEADAAKLARSIWTGEWVDSQVRSRAAAA